MPIKGSIGMSAQTARKHEDFRAFLAMHMHVTHAILHKHQAVAAPNYLYVDLNAGAGDYRDEQDRPLVGSPCIAVEEATRQAVPLHMLLCERDTATATHLRQALHARGLQWVASDVYSLPTVDGPPLLATIAAGDHQTVPERLAPLLTWSRQRTPARRLYGLIYSDENGGLPPFPLLAHLGQLLPTCEILLYVACTPIKRQVYSPKHALTTHLHELLGTIPKKRWLIREHDGRHHWTFLLGTNWEDFPEYRSKRFHDIHSLLGWDILRRVTFNTQDYTDQRPLWGAL